MYLDGYHDHLLFKLKKRVPVITGPWSSQLHDEARARYDRFDSHLRHLVDDDWFSEFDEQASRLLDPKVYRKAISGRACHRCEALAKAAAFALENDEVPAPSIFLSCLLAGAGLPCVGVEDLLVSGFPSAGEGLSPVMVGRTMQLIGVQACLRRGRSIRNCYCARDIVRFEGEPTLTRLLKSGAHDWEGLGDLGLAA